VRTSQRARETRSAGLQEDSPITRIFVGILQSSVRSRGAKVDSVSLEPFNHLDLDISSPSATTVKGAIQAFCKDEEVNDGKSTRRIQFKTLPKVLVLCLKRFAYVYNQGRGTAQKVTKSIRFDEKLLFEPAWLADAAPAPSAAPKAWSAGAAARPPAPAPASAGGGGGGGGGGGMAKPPEYLLTSVICHHGEAVNRGHYTAYVRYNAEWYLYDDTIIRRVDAKEVAAQQSTAYLLVYQSRTGAVDMTP